MSVQNPTFFKATTKSSSQRDKNIPCLEYILKLTSIQGKENMTHNEKKNQSIEDDPEIAQKIKSAEMNVLKAIVNTFKYVQ